MNNLSDDDIGKSKMIIGLSDEHYYDDGKLQLLQNENCYYEEWERLFEGKFQSRLQTMGLRGQLRTTHFRGICWRIYLECLPEKQSEWITATTALRQKYEAMQYKLQNNPRVEKNGLDLCLNNPLSQEDQSPWNQYFQDSELKITIHQDVIRTFPEIDFFQSSKLQSMMVNILFCFAREYPHISYRQGMHELLAPILYVLHSDQQAFHHHNISQRKLMNEAEILLDPTYTEHDAFFIFCQVMDIVESWYLVNDFASNKYMDQFVFEPFSRPRDSGPTSVIGVKLTKIYEQILRRHDPELFAHLESLEIAPQIYGIRWLRLLFGREFSMQDLLQIWDAIFADSLSFDLVDYIFASMLMCIRELLLSGDYATCLKHLMKFPTISDVSYIIMLALHLRDPLKFAQPKGYSMQVITTPSGICNNIHNTPTKIVSAIKGSNKMTGSSFTLIMRKGGGRPKTLALPISNTGKSVQGKSCSEPATLESTSPSSDSEVSSGISVAADRSREKYKQHFRQPSDSIMHSLRHSGNNTSLTLPRKSRITKEQPNLSQSLTHLDKDKSIGMENLSKEMVTLTHHPSHHGVYRQISKEKEEIRQLKTELSELKSMSDYCWHRMTRHLDRLQYCMIHQQLQHEDEMLLALAGLKRVRDILKGTVNFSEEVGDDEYCCDMSVNEHKNMQKDRLQLNSDSFEKRQPNEEHFSATTNNKIHSAGDSLNSEHLPTCIIDKGSIQNHSENQNFIDEANAAVTKWQIHKYFSDSLKLSPDRNEENKKE